MAIGSKAAGAVHARYHRLLKTAAATEGRAQVSLWDLWLLPWCTVHAPEGQAAVDEWLAAQLGAPGTLAPPRLTRVVEAFEAQAALEQEAEDLDYGADGRLRFRAEVDEHVHDAKGAAQVARLTHTRRRRYGDAHVGARLRQVDELSARIDAYAGELAAHRAGLAAYAAQSLWLDPGFAERIGDRLAATQAALHELAQRAARARAAFAALPRLPVDPGTLPEPIAHELVEP